MKDITQLSDEELANLASPQPKPLSELSDAELAALQQPSMSTDIGRGLGLGAQKAVSGTLGLPGDIAELLNRGVQYGVGKLGLPTAASNPDLLGSAQIQRGIESLTGQVTPPQTVPGKLIEKLGEFAPAVIGGPETMAAKIGTRVLAPATAMTAAEGMTDNPLAQIGAAVGASVLAHKAITPSIAAGPKTAEVGTAATSIYKDIENATVGVPFSNRDTFVNDLKDTLNKAAKREANVPDVYAAINQLPKNADVADLVILQKNLTPLVGREGVAARIAIQQVEKEIERLVPGAGKLLTEADQNWNAFRTAQGLDKRIAKAELQTSSTHSGTNLGNKLRQSAAAAAVGPQSRFMKPDEIKALEAVARGTFLQNQLRSVGNLIGGGVGLGGLFAGETLGGHEGGALGGLGVLLAGRGLRGAFNRSVARQASQVSQQILARSPEAQRYAALLARTALPTGLGASQTGLLAGLLASRGLLGQQSQQ